MSSDEIYTAEGIIALMEPDFERLFTPYSQGRPPGWSYDWRTKALICSFNWLNEQFVKMGLSGDDRRTQLWQFSRRTRSEEDVYQVAADVMNQAVVGDIEQHRVGHRRWG